MNLIFFLHYVFFYFTFGSSCQTYVVMFCLFLLIRKYVVRFSLAFSRNDLRFKRICQINKGSTLVSSARFKPENMFKIITGLTLLKHRSLHGLRRVKSADKTNCWRKKTLRTRKQKRSDVSSSSLKKN